MSAFALLRGPRSAVGAAQLPVEGQQPRALRSRTACSQAPSVGREAMRSSSPRKNSCMDLALESGPGRQLAPDLFLYVSCCDLYWHGCIVMLISARVFNNL